MGRPVLGKVRSVDVRGPTGRPSSQVGNSGKKNRFISWSYVNFPYSIGLRGSRAGGKAETGREIGQNIEL